MVNFWQHNTPVYHRVKAAPWDDINFNKVVYTPDHELFFLEFLD